jgi:hypothetical protein
MSTNQEPTDPMRQFFKSLFEESLDEALERRNAIFPIIDEETAQKIARINAKPRITIPEAALLLGCSTSHLYTKITAARKGKAKHPIPFLDLDGVYVLPREELLKWAATEKEQSRQKKVKSRALTSVIDSRATSPTAPNERSDE